MQAQHIGGGTHSKSTYYRPGEGWGAAARHKRYSWLKPAATVTMRPDRITPLFISAPRRPGIIVRAIIVAAIVCVAAVLIAVFQGALGI